MARQFPLDLPCKDHRHLLTLRNRKTNGVKNTPQRTLAICKQFVTATTAGQLSVLNHPGKSPICNYVIHDLLKAVALV